MLASLPQPVLSLASEALHSVAGEDATTILWKVFTKCKDYVDEGPRLENISWRIWYRDYHSNRTTVSAVPGHSSVESSPGFECPPSEYFKSLDMAPLKESSPCPTPVPASVTSSARDDTETLRLLTPASSKRAEMIPIQMDSAASFADLRSARRYPANHPTLPLPIGETICSLLPKRIPHRPDHWSHSSYTSSSRSSPPSLVRHDTDSGVAESVHENDHDEQEMMPSTAPLLVVPPSTPPAPGMNRPGPKVVIVNPTPHPTPPATPDITHPPSNIFPPSSSSRLGALLSPPEVMPTMRLPDAVTLPATSPTFSTGAASSVTTLSSTGSSEDQARDGKIFFLPTSSPQSQSLEKPLIIVPIAVQAPLISGQIQATTDCQTTASANAATNGPSQLPSSLASNSGRSIVSLASGKVKRGKETARHVRTGSRSKSSGKASISGSAARQQAKAQEVTQSKKAAIANTGSASSAGSRSCEQVVGKSLPSSLSKRSKGRESHQRKPSTSTNPNPPRPGTLQRVATQPLPASASKPALRNHVGFPQLQGHHLAQPPVPPPNGNRRRVEIITTSSDFETEDSDWSSTSDNEGEGKQENNKESSARGQAVHDGGQLSKAAVEAARQRDFFTKLPKRSYSNLAKRSQSGLLTNLFHPDPNLFPEGHPYRTSLSHHDLVSKPGAPGRGPVLYYGAIANGTVRQGTGSRAPLPAPAAKLSTSKSAVALPAMAKISAAAANTENQASGSGSRGYRPRARPSDVEVSDDSGDEDPDDTVQMSRSVAHEKLAALAGRKAPPVLQHAPQRTSSGTGKQRMQPKALQQLPRTPPKSQPMAIGYPYNLPAPNPPTSPNTTIKAMYEAELGLSLMRHLQREHTQGNGLRPEGVRFVKNQSPEKEAEDRQRQLQRNKSWAAHDFHTTGW